jgi:hypothetical protein
VSKIDSPQVNANSNSETAGSDDKETEHVVVGASESQLSAKCNGLATNQADETQEKPVPTKFEDVNQQKVSSPVAKEKRVRLKELAEVLASDVSRTSDLKDTVLRTRSFQNPTQVSENSSFMLSSPLSNYMRSCPGNANTMPLQSSSSAGPTLSSSGLSSVGGGAGRRRTRDGRMPSDNGSVSENASISKRQKKSHHNPSSEKRFKCNFYVYDPSTYKKNAKENGASLCKTPRKFKEWRYATQFFFFFCFSSLSKVMTQFDREHMLGHRNYRWSCTQCQKPCEEYEDLWRHHTENNCFGSVPERPPGIFEHQWIKYMNKETNIKHPKGIPDDDDDKSIMKWKLLHGILFPEVTEESMNACC